jgi:hypothetical protein
MSEVTLELVQAKQTELAALIEKLARSSLTVRIPAVEIVLQPGEWYAGAVLNEDGSVKHHIVVAAVSESKLDYEDAQTFARDRGLSAPTRQETRLIVANKYERLASLSWIWTCEPYEGNDECAWDCYLYDGGVSNDVRSAEGGAVAVRRVVPSVL